MISLKQSTLSIPGSEFLRRRSPSPNFQSPVFPVVNSSRSSIFSLSKPLHISSVESFFPCLKKSSKNGKEKDQSLVRCKAYEADRSEPIRDSTLARSEAARKVKIGTYFATWWALNVIFNIYNKKVLNAFPFPWLTSTLSLAAGSLIMLVSWALRIAETPKTDLEFWKSLFPVSIYRALHRLGLLLIHFL